MHPDQNETEQKALAKKLRSLDILRSEAHVVREQDKMLVRSLIGNFNGQGFTVGIGFQRAFGSVLSGDYFDFIRLPDDEYLFIFADAKGHGLPAYTTLIRFRSAISLAVKQIHSVKKQGEKNDTDSLVKDICTKFTDIMEDSASEDMACACFTFFCRTEEGYELKIYNRGMPFPFAVRKKTGEVMVVNLNEVYEGWNPESGSILGTDVRSLMGSAYDDAFGCRYVLDEGDSLFFYSDGLIEACPDEGSEDFGEERIGEILMEYSALHPQVAVEEMFRRIYAFLEGPSGQKDDMTAVLIGFPFMGKKQTE